MNTQPETTPATGRSPAPAGSDVTAPERTMRVGMSAPGFAGQFELPERHFNDLLAWLAERACKRTSQQPKPE